MRKQDRRPGYSDLARLEFVLNPVGGHFAERREFDQVARAPLHI